jgi:major membrane immunogen (membrane-anchored lipoprotein)
MIRSFLIALAAAALIPFLLSNRHRSPGNFCLTPALQDTLKKYSDGRYMGTSRDKYTDEPYWGIAYVTIEKGKIAAVSFSIRDSAKHETFEKGYERHFASIPEYVEQCKNDLKGVHSYPSLLAGSGTLSKVDAITGATWSYNIFRASVSDALSKAVSEKK